MPADQPWPAPLAAGSVHARVEVPGSKSLTNRALVLAALADGPSTISRPLKARDTKLMAAGLRSLGVSIKSTDEGWAVEPADLRGPAHVDCGLAGTVMRFLPVVAGLAKGDVRFDGDPRARMRPMGAILVALEALGVRIDDDGRNALPFTIRGQGQVSGGSVTLDASDSSQYVSALLLSGARFDEGLRVRHHGAALPSLPHIEMSAAMLRESGVEIDSQVDDPTDAWWDVAPGRIRAVDRTIEPDLSNAAPFLAAAMVTGGQVTIPQWPTATTQPGDQLRAIFAEMGATTTLTADGLTLTGPDVIRGVDLNLRDVGELTPVVAAVAALAETPSPAARDRAPAGPRDRPAGGAVDRDQPDGRGGRRQGELAAHHPAPACTAQSSRPTTRLVPLGHPTAQSHVPYRGSELDRPKVSHQKGNAMSLVCGLVVRHY